MAIGTAILTAAWFAFASGAGTEAADYVRLINPVVGAERIGSRLDAARRGFVLGGGRTNLTPPSKPVASAPARTPQVAGGDESGEAHFSNSIYRGRDNNHFRLPLFWSVHTISAGGERCTDAAAVSDQCAQSNGFASFAGNGDPPERF